MPICVVCRHLHRNADVFSCTAYPNGIPFEISNNQIDHRSPYIGDGGVIFDLNSDKIQTYNRIVSVLGWDNGPIS